MKQKKLLFAFFILSMFVGFAQKGNIKGKVYNAKTNEPLPFAAIIIDGTAIGATSDLDGNFLFTGVEPGFKRLLVSSVGFETTRSAQFQLLGNQTAFIEVAVKENMVALEEVVVRRNTGVLRLESPVSIQTLGVQDIEKSAGANRDVSKIVQNLPGVGATDPNRNDLIVRGGGPSENVFFLDGIEIPIINHFATQGASGGSVGILNPDFIREINFYTGAFPANRTNALSSVMDIRQKDGRQDRLHGKFSVGASDAALTLDGPLGANSNFMISARRSYLQFLFSALQLPFLPVYNDFQLKYKVKFDTKNELSIIGLGAIDQMTLNTGLSNPDEGQRYILGFLPIYEQWNYTIGAVYKHFGSGYFETWVLSRNMLRNHNYKYVDNDEAKPKSLDYNSDEAENKIRYERTITDLPVLLMVGGGLKYSTYTNQTQTSLFFGGVPQSINYDSKLNLFGYQFFAQASKEFYSKLKTSLGVSMVGNTYTSYMSNPFNQISPRFSLSYQFRPRLAFNFNTGRYMQQPAYTMMGFRNNQNQLVNQTSDFRYITSNHIIGGLEYHPSDNMTLSAEGFFKYYQNYPISLLDSVSLAGKGVNFGSVGDEPVQSKGLGRAYGFELLYRVNDFHKFNALATFTLFYSEFTNFEGEYQPSSWDTRYLFNILLNRTFAGYWTIGARWRYVGGAPYTPIDLATSSNIEAWDAKNQAYLDYDAYNTLRLPNAHQLDIRIDKEFFFKRWALNLYIDVQNVYNFESQGRPIYTNLDSSGAPQFTTNEQGEAIYDLRPIYTFSGTILPTLGIIATF